MLFSSWMFFILLITHALQACAEWKEKMTSGMASLLRCLHSIFTARNGASMYQEFCSQRGLPWVCTLGKKHPPSRHPQEDTPKYPRGGWYTSNWNEFLLKKHCQWWIQNFPEGPEILEGVPTYYSAKFLQRGHASNICLHRSSTYS